MSKWILWSYIFCSGLVLDQSIRLPIFQEDYQLYHSNSKNSDEMNSPDTDYEIVDFPHSVLDFQSESEDFPLEFQAFERPVSLKLKRNTNLISPNLLIKMENDIKKGIDSNNYDCHYINSDSNSGIVAGLSACDSNSINGIIVLPDETLEIQPLKHNSLGFWDKRREPLMEYDDRGGSGVPHIVKRAAKLPKLSDDFKWKTFNREPLLGNFSEEFSFNRNKIDDYYEEEISPRDGKEKLILEVALFFDQAGYEIFAPFFDNDSEKLTNMLLAYLNGVQALYNHPSLGRSVDIVLVYLEIMKTQPPKMPTFEGERGQLLDSFCDYQKSLNPKSDSDPNHWDMALYISGLDFFHWEGNNKNGVTMGLATVGGVCLAEYNCIIAEFGTTNAFGRPFPSAGFTSVYILAHEIGHNLGMSHDSTNNQCPKDGFVMSPSRGTQGETIWSSCSADVLKTITSWANCLNDEPKDLKKEYDSTNMFKGIPGQFYTAKKQCEILLRDKDASPNYYDGEEAICQNLPCRTPHRIGYYFAGPALEGTDCGNGKFCQGGSCVIKEIQNEEILPVPGGWSPWKEQKCQSGCIYKSKGFQERHRICNKPSPQHTDEGCEGMSYDVVLCDDKDICARNRKLTPTNYATERCQHFSTLLPELDGDSPGIQAPHEEQRLWMACAVFCRRKDWGVYYTPRLDLNDLGVDAYFPDGTWCHHDSQQSYYCLRHHCLPESFKFSKTEWPQFGDDLSWVGNAQPKDEPQDESVLKYLSLDPTGEKPLSTHLKHENKEWKEGDWTSKDFIPLPNDNRKREFYFMK